MKVRRAAEACAASHHWSRELPALGHTVRLMPPAYVKPYVKRQKNDAADAEAICEAVIRVNMRFVPTKTPVQQSCMMLQRTRAPVHSPANCGDQSDPRPSRRFLVDAPVGHGVEHRLAIAADLSDERLLDVARRWVAALGAACPRPA